MPLQVLKKHWEVCQSQDNVSTTSRAEPGHLLREGNECRESGCRANDGCASNDPEVWAHCRDIKANLPIEKRGRVHPAALGSQRVQLSVWMELWELVVYTCVFDGSFADCCRCFAAACDFILKIVLRHWREWKATSNIWQELFLFTSLLCEILLLKAGGDVGHYKDQLEIEIIELLSLMQLLWRTWL